jgi:HAMP domain-containing protein
MQLSLRTRLTVWYSVLLVLSLVLFSTAVLWLHWQLLLDQFDDGLKSIGVTAGNVVEEELGELNDMSRAVADMAMLVHPADGTVAVLDSTGVPVGPLPRGMPVPGGLRWEGFTPATMTLMGSDGLPWRVIVRARAAHGHQFLVAVGAPLDEALEQWQTLLKASLIGIPLAVIFAVAGGWWVGQHGLRPVTGMAAEAREITAKTLDRRLTVPHAATELAQLAGSFNRVLDRLGSALATQRQFMADASHELRTPVSIMRTAADVTLSQPHRDEPEYREAVAVFAQQTLRLTRLVDDMLVLARADGGGYPIVPVEVDVARLVNDCVQEFAGRAREKRLRVQTSVQPLTLTADETLLRRML